MTVRLMSGSSDNHHAPAHMTKSSLTWLSASSHDCQSRLLITFYLTCNQLLSSPLLLRTTFNLYSHSTMLSQLLLSLSPLPFATLPILRFTTLTNRSHPTTNSLIKLPLPPFSLHSPPSLWPYTLIMLTTCITHSVLLVSCLYYYIYCAVGIQESSLCVSTPNTVCNLRTLSLLTSWLPFLTLPLPFAAPIILNGYHFSDPQIGIETPCARPGWNPNSDTCPHQL